MSSFVDIVNGFEKKKVAVIGDVMLDEYVFGDVSRISPEAPIPIVKVNRNVYSPGGASNTAVNIKSLGGEAYLIGLVGNDYNGRMLKEILQNSGINIHGLVESSLRKTTLKTRIVAHKQQLIRLDNEEDDYLNHILEGQIIAVVERVIRDCDIVVVSDYAKGVVSKNLMSHLVPLVRSANKTLIIDPRPQNKSFYKGCDFITPNLSEAKAMVGPHEDYKEIGKKLLEEFNCNVLLTRGEHGMSLFTKSTSMDFSCEDFDAITKEVYDVTGAGDTVVAALALSLAAGASYAEAVEISNHAAGIVVGKFGSATISRGELIKALNNSKT